MRVKILLDCSGEEHPPHKVFCHSLFLSVFLSLFYMRDSLQDCVALTAVTATLKLCFSLTSFPDWCKPSRLSREYV